MRKRFRNGTTMFFDSCGTVQCEDKKVLRCIRLSGDARLPKKASPFSVGMDLESSECVVVEPGERAAVNTDLVLIPPNGHYCRIAGRSGLALKRGIMVGGGVIDPDYRGPVKIIVINTGKELFKVNIGDRIAQVICETASVVEAEEGELSELDNTERGAKGFGSSGVTGEELKEKGGDSGEILI